MRFLHPRTMTGTLAFLGIGGAAALAELGCGDKVAMYGPASECSMNCGVNSSGGGPAPDGGTTSTSSGAGGGVAVGTLQGDVEPFSGPGFAGTTGSPITGAASITFQPSSGPALYAQYGSTSGTTFDVTNVPSGEGWVTVQDESQGANGIWTTITALSVPQLTNFTVPVVNQSTMTSLASILSPVLVSGVSPEAAQIVLLLEYNGQPFSGVSVTSGPSGAVVVYDDGPGVYSYEAMTTGSGGTILVFNAGGSGMQTITVTSTQLMKSYMLPVPTAAGAVTVVGFNLQ